MTLHAIRTMLFVPGDRPDRIAKALSSGADCIAVDLEDAIAHSHKVQARQGAVEAISVAKTDGPLIAIRVNSPTSVQLESDLEALLPVWPVLDFIVLPMVSNAKTILDMVERLAEADEFAKCAGSGPRLIPLIETAQGVLAAKEIAAAHQRVYTLAFGPADLLSPAWGHPDRRWYRVASGSLQHRVGGSCRRLGTAHRWALAEHPRRRRPPALRRARAVLGLLRQARRPSPPAGLGPPGIHRYLRRAPVGE